MIVPWRCHICASDFDKYDGGVCARCRKAACLDHLRLVGYESAQGPARSEQIACASCVRADEQARRLEKRFFAESAWARRLGF